MRGGGDGLDQAGMTLNTPERRRRIEQLVRNEFPGCAAVFVMAPVGGLAFRICAPCGCVRSGIITLLAHHGHIRLNRSWLAGKMNDQGGPAAGGMAGRVKRSNAGRS